MQLEIKAIRKAKFYKVKPHGEGRLNISRGGELSPVKFRPQAA